MALRAKVLKKKADKFELKKLEEFNLDNKRILALEPLLQDVYASMRPKPADYDIRRRLVRVFNEIAKEIYGKSKNVPVVVEFGSFVMDLFSTTSDLDLSVNFSNAAADFSRGKKIQTLRKFARKLYALQSKGYIHGVLPITTAKVPILKCVDCGTGVECDISAENRDGILKSQIIHMIASIDERFQKLSFLMKIWANAHNINSSKDRSLNSLSIIQLVAFHLQTRNPPVLPPFSAIFKDGVDRAFVAKSVSDFANFGKGNHESLSKLFITLLIKLSSVEKLWRKGLCISNCTASWISKSWNSKVACISVEDFTDPSQNVSRAVGQQQLERIYDCINFSLHQIQSFLSGEVDFELKDLLFKRDFRPVIPSDRIAAAPREKRGKRKRAASYGSKVKNRTGDLLRKKTVRQKLVDGRSKLLEPIPAKSMSTGDGWSRIPNGDWEAAYVDYLERTRTNQQKASIRWGGGWEGTQLPQQSGGRNQMSAVGGWEGTRQCFSSGWGATHQPHAGEGWSQRKQPDSRAWGQRQWPGTGSWRWSNEVDDTRGWGSGGTQSWGGSSWSWDSNQGWGG